MTQRMKFVVTCLDECLLYSGQYALFYIVMNLCEDQWKFFHNFGHTVLLSVLLVQTLLLARWGTRPLYRFLGSLLAPLCYTIVEFEEGMQFVLNGAHVFFWIYSLLTGALQALALVAGKRLHKAVLEFCISTLNVLAFLFLYYYFELKLDFAAKLAAGALGESRARESLEFYRMFSGYPEFLRDPTHVYVLIAGLILSFTISMSRVKILLLKEKIHELFGSYVDKSVSDKIIRQHGGNAERKSVCVLFSDIRDFTTLSERNSPAKVTSMLNLYFSEWETSVARHHGVIDKFIGDAVMVVFGMDGDPGACACAVRCAEEMLGKLEVIKSRLTAGQLPPLHGIGIGLHFGSAIIGDVGSPTRRNYTVIGDTVNTASRIEGLCKQYQTPLIISPAVLDQLPENLKQNYTFLDQAVLKGKAERYSIYGRRP